jgi:AcrR family transcriptional regulator
MSAGHQGGPDGGRCGPHGRVRNAPRPLYKRLPHGPHQLDPRQVALHQRARIHGAMIEAVAQNGYQGVSVKQVIALAGVSRRSFYELFANKRECFLETVDQVASVGLRRARSSYTATEGAPEARLGAALAAVAASALREPQAAMLMLAAAPSAGRSGTARLCRASAVCERLLGEWLSDTGKAATLPAPVLHGIVGGLQGILAARCVDGTAVAPMSEELLQWTLAFRVPAEGGDAERLRKHLTERVRRVSGAGSRAPLAPPRGPEDPRTRMLESVLRLAGGEEQATPNAVRIADEAGVGIDAFFDLFASNEECLQSALAFAGEQLLSAATPGLPGEQWPRAIRRTLGGLLGHLATHPLHARALVYEAHISGEISRARSAELSAALAALLTRGAPEAAGAAGEAIAGAFWHTVRWQVANRRIEMLAALSDHLAFVVLAPLIGADRAVALICEAV